MREILLRPLEPKHKAKHRPQNYSQRRNPAPSRRFGAPAIRWSRGRSCRWSSAPCPCVSGGGGAPGVLSSREAGLALLPLTAWGEPRPGKAARVCPPLAAAGSCRYSAGSWWAAGRGRLSSRRLEEPDERKRNNYAGGDDRLELLLNGGHVSEKCDSLQKYIYFYI